MVWFTGLQSVMAQAAVLPSQIKQVIGVPVQPLGQTKYSKLGFSIYEAILFTPNKSWEPNQPYALQLIYKRSLSRDTLVKGIMDGIREQNVVDEATLTQWQDDMNKALPDVASDDSITGVAMPGREAGLYYNNKPIMQIKDSRLSKAFFDVWLGKTADEDMRKELLAQAQ
jgi:hypothetical protein